MNRGVACFGLAAALALSAGACSDSRRRAGGGDASGRDAGGPGDAAAIDAYVPPTDGGEPGLDADVPGLDAGDPGLDAGSPGFDAGGSGFDAGGPGYDAGRDAGADAGRDAGTDAGRDAGSDAGRVDGGPAGPCTPLPAAGAVTVSGTFSAASPTWTRPSASLGCPGTVSTTTAPYATYVYCNTGAAARSFDVALDGADESAALTLSDPYLVIYAGTAIPADVTMCLDADDDSSPAGLGSLVTALSVAAGQRITIVPTSYSATTTGSWQLRITGL